MVYVTITFELTATQMEALKFESMQTNLTVEQLMAWMVRQNIPPLLDVIEGDGRRQELIEALQEEDIRERDSVHSEARNQLFFEE